MFARKRSRTGRLLGWTTAAALVGSSWAVWTWVPRSTPTDSPYPALPPSPSSSPSHEMVHVPGGPFVMGDDFSVHDDARPAHMVNISSFRIDAFEVTNAKFAQFIVATRYETTAEQVGHSHVYDRLQKEWLTVKGANWRHPGGPDTSIAGRELHPAVHVSWYDATAYAHWSGKRLPTEAEWEYAARGGLFDAQYPWGREILRDGSYQNNFWQPPESTGDGFLEQAPVGSFAPNPFGIYDISGNVWEWCADGYDEGYYQRSAKTNPQGPQQATLRIRRGGSWLSTDGPGSGIHVATRSYVPPGRSSNHMGFRCVRGDAVKTED